MALAASWGIFGATWYLFAIEELGLDPAAIGLIAAVGGVSSLGGALLAGRMTRRLGIGPTIFFTGVVAGLGSLFIPLAPAGAPLVAMAFLLGQQLITDPAMTIYDINDTSIRQAIVHDRQLGRVNATVHVLAHIAQLTVTIAAGVLALMIGLRFVGFLSVLGALVAAIALWNSPIRRMRTLEDAPG
jgi:MFS family permease